MTETILAKIQKLMRLQESAQAIGSIAEAANAAERVQDLLLKYNLSMAEVEGFEEDESKVIHEIVNASDLNFNHREGKWLTALAGGLSRYNMCRSINTVSGNKLVKITFIGEPQNLEVVRYLFEILVPRARQLVRQEFNRYNGLEKLGTFRRGYLMGFAMGVSTQLREAQERQERESAQVTALVRVKSEAVEKKTEELFPYLRSARSSRTSSLDGSMRGYTAGKSTLLNKGVGGRSSKGFIS